MTKELIDWATVPEGVIVIDAITGIAGKLLETDGIKAFVHYKGLFDAGLSDCCGLRLAPADQQPWLVYTEGETVIPEWAECSFKGSSTGIGEHAENYAAAIDYVAKYKLGNGKGNLFKDGWTDNPNEVK